MPQVNIAEVIPSTVEVTNVPHTNIRGRILVDGTNWPQETVKHFNLQFTFDPGQLLIVMQDNSVAGLVAGQLLGPTEDLKESSLNVTIVSGQQLVLLGA